MKMVLARDIGYSYSIDDKQKFESEWAYEAVGFCMACKKAIGLRLRFPKHHDDQKIEKPKDEIIELEVREMFKRRHWPNCAKRILVVGHA